MKLERVDAMLGGLALSWISCVDLLSTEFEVVDFPYGSEWERRQQGTSVVHRGGFCRKETELVGSLSWKQERISR